MHSFDEERFVLIGRSIRGRLLVVVHIEKRVESVLSAPELQQKKRDSDMKRMKRDPDMLEEYDFSGGVGKKGVNDERQTASKRDAGPVH